MRRTRILFLLALLLGLVVGATAACGVYFLTVGEIAWQKYLEEELVPAATTAISAIAVIGIGISPVVKKVMSSAVKFDSATTKVNETVESGKKAVVSVERFEAKIAEKMEDVMRSTQEALREQEKRVKSVETHVENTEKMIKIGFCNMKELVTKGYASAIAKVGTENEQNEI